MQRDGENGNFIRTRMHVANDIYLTAQDFKGAPCVDLRRFYNPKKKNETEIIKPTRMGITFTPEEWKQLELLL